MKKNKPNQDKPALLLRKLVRHVTTIAVFSVVITGGLAAFYWTYMVSNRFNAPVKNQMDKIMPGLFEIAVLIIIGVILSLGVAYFLFKKTFRQLDSPLRRVSLQEDIEESETNDIHTIDDYSDNSYAPETETVRAISPDSDEMSGLKDTLESEKSLNSLVLSLLNIHDDNGAEYKREILSKFGSFCKSDYISFYQRNETNGNFNRLCFQDANPALSRHSDKLDSLDCNQYQWLIQTLNTGKTFILNKSDMDNLIESLQDNKDDAKIWMQTLAKDTAEYTLCKHEDWQHMVAAAYLDDKSLESFFLIGFHSASFPLSEDVVERLSTISGALGKRISASKPCYHPDSSQDSIETTLANIPHAIFVTDAEGKITMANLSAVKLSNLSHKEIISMPWQKAFHLIYTEDKNPIADPINNSAKDHVCVTLPDDVALLSSDGTELSVEGLVAPISDIKDTLSGFVFLLMDVTNRINAENERLKTQKMEAISSLSAGLAHDFNNLLTAILGNISLVMDDLTPDSEQAILLKAAEDCTLKGKEITDRLLTFAKSSPQKGTYSDVALILKNTVRELIPENTKVKVLFQIEDNLPQIAMSSSAFETVIRNLVNNSLQAMNPGGELSIMANVRDNSDGRIATLKRDTYVCIHIIDTGEGISRENLCRIFTPYFSTREGRSGLGLPTVNSILSKHNAVINLQSQSGKGTDCELYVPIKQPINFTPVISEPLTVTSKLNTLVLDEEDMLGSLLIKTLNKMGLLAEKTSDPDKLVQIYLKSKDNGNKINLVIVNLDISSESDVQTIAFRLKQIDSKLKLIAYSGYLKPDDIKDFQTKGFDDILHKPFNVSDLKALVTKTLEA